MSTSSSVGVTTGKTVKTVLNGDFRRFLLSKPSFEELTKSLLSTYGPSLPSSFSVKYQDDEDESCTITSDVELLEAFSVCDQHKRPVLKLVITPLDEPMETDAPETKEAKKEHPEESKQEKKSFSLDSVLENLRVLSQDAKAQAALPVAVQAALGALERAPSIQDVIKAGVDASSYLKTHSLVKEMLGQLSSIPEDVNRKFLLLKSNPSTLGMIRMWLPSLVANIPLLVSMLPMILENLASGGFGGPFGGPFGGFGGPGFGGPGPFHHAFPHPPPFGGPGAFPHPPFGGPGFPQPTAPSGRSDSPKPKGEEVHFGVRCDGCNRDPIRGVRYKCSVCANYDVCQECETKNVHPEHPFLKIRASETSDPETESVSSTEGRGWGRGWRRFGHGHGPHFGHHMHGMHHGMHHGGRGRWASLFGPQAQNWRCPRGERGEKVRVKFVENVTIPERAVVLPGQTLIKTWRVENVGKTDWPENSKLIFLRGDRSMSTEEEFPVPMCKAGQSVEVSAVILTPTQQGRHTAVFRLADAERVPFGPRLWCDVVVPDLSGGEPTPSPSAPSAPTNSPWPAGDAPMEVTKEEPKLPSKQSSTDKPQALTADKSQGSTTDKPAPKEPKEPGKYTIQLRALASMGFKDEELNMFLLESHNGNVQTVCEQLLQNLR